MARLSPKEEKDTDDDRLNNSSSEKIRLYPFCVFDRYYRTDDNKGKGKGGRG